MDDINNRLKQIERVNKEILYYLKKLVPNEYKNAPKIDMVAIEFIQQLPEYVPITEHELYDIYVKKHKEAHLLTPCISKRSFNALVRSTFDDDYVLKNTTRKGHQTRLWTINTR